MRQLTRLAAALGVAALTYGCGGGDSGPDCDPIAGALVERVEVTPNSGTVELGDSLQLTARAFSCDGQLSGLPPFEWRSADPATLTVSSTGLVKALAVGGTVAVTATVQGKTGTANIGTALVPVATVEVTPPTATIGVGRTSTLTARALDAQGRELTGRPVTWASANANVVGVNASGQITGVTLGGPVSVTATIEGKSDASAVTVVQNAVATVAVTPGTASLSGGQTQQLTATLRDDLGAVLTGRAVAWSSSDETVATVSSTGLVTARRPGTATITATSEGRSGTSTITVTVGPPARLGFVEQPSAVTAGAVMSPAVTVEVLDAGGNRVTTSSASITLAVSSPGSLGGTSTVQASNGLATFSNLIVNTTTAGNYTLTASSSGLTPVTSSAFAVALPAVQVTTATLPNAVIGTAYPATTLAATGGTGSYTWSVTSGTLPPGLSLGANGAITGTPTTTTQAAYTFTVQVSSGAQTATRQLTINVFAPLTVTITGAGANGTVTSAPPGINCTLTSGTAGGDCTETVAAGTSVTLTATAGASSTFSGWSGACNGSGGCTVVVDRVRAVTATFAQANNVLTVAVSGANANGTVTSAPTGINCTLTTGTQGGTCSAGYTSGTVTLTATPGTGSSFGAWTGCASTSGNTCTVNMNQDRNVTATFTRNTANLTVTSTAGGTVSSNPAGISCGATCAAAFPTGTSITLTATAQPGSAFGSWTNCPTPSANTCTVVLNTNTSVSATFTANLTVSVSGNGGVTSAPAGISCGTAGSDCAQAYAVGTSVTLTASPASGATFSSWTGCPAPSGTTCVVAVNGATSVTATFAVQNLTLTVARSGAGSGTVTSNPAGISCGATCAAAFAAGSTITLTATPGTGSVVGAWSGCSSTAGNTCTVVLNSATAVGATFLSQPNITTGALPAATQGQSYTQNLAVTGGTPTYTWALSAGTLPDGIGLSAAGVLSGVPTTTGSSNFTVQVTDGQGLSDTQALTLDVAAAAVLTPVQLAFLVQPTNVDRNTAIAPPVQVEVQDATGARVTTAAVPVTIAIGTNPGGGTLSGTLTRTSVNGVATFNDLRINAAANGYTLLASSGGLTSATSQTFRVR